MNQGPIPNQNREINVKMPSMSLGVGIVLSLILLSFIYYFAMPVWSIRFVGWPFSLAIALSPLLAVKRSEKLIKGLYFVLLAFVVVMLIISAPIFRAKSYRNMIGEVKLTELSKLLSPVNLEQVPIVDRFFASSLAEKKLGEDFALGSRVTLGWPTRQMVRGKLYWVIPLLHSGFFKWLTNVSEGTPGYIMVSATNPQDITFVRESAGKPITLKYQQNSFFNQKLHRHLYLNGYITKGIGDYTFEVDEDGVPYWTVTVYDHRIGAAASDALGLAVVNAQNGDIQYYPMIKAANGYSDENIPAWIDRVQPAEFVLAQLDWWGKYVRGFWNTLFGKRDMLMVTDGYNIIYGTDNRNYFYTGMSSIGSDEGTVGFVLTDTRSKRTHLYRMSGATEYAAMQSAEGKVQNFKYRATFPILVNLQGVPTYFMTLKDGAGLVKMFAFVSVKDFSLAGVGESIRLARDSYQMLLTDNRIGSLEGGTTETVLSGTIARIGSEVKENRTYYYLSLVEDTRHIYVCTTSLSSFLAISRPGDKVKLSYYSASDIEINAVSFVNLSLQGQ